MPAFVVCVRVILWTHFLWALVLLSQPRSPSTSNAIFDSVKCGWHANFHLWFTVTIAEREHVGSLAANNVYQTLHSKRIQYIKNTARASKQTNRIWMAQKLPIEKCRTICLWYTYAVFPLSHLLAAAYCLLLHLKLWTETPTTTAYSKVWYGMVEEWQSIRIFFKYVWKKEQDSWQQYEYRVQTNKTQRKPSSSVTAWRAHQLTSNSMIAFASQCHAMQEKIDGCVFESKLNQFYPCYSSKPISMRFENELEIHCLSSIPFTFRRKKVLKCLAENRKFIFVTKWKLPSEHWLLFLSIAQSLRLCFLCVY